MLIATLQRLALGRDKEDMIYCATDPIDGELLTEWYDTIMQVQADLDDQGGKYGLMLACYQGESDVPARLSDEEADEADHDSISCGCPAIPCH